MPCIIKDQEPLFDSCTNVNEDACQKQEMKRSMLYFSAGIPNRRPKRLCLLSKRIYASNTEDSATVRRVVLPTCLFKCSRVLKLIFALSKNNRDPKLHRFQATMRPEDDVSG